jgi:hypothetical protein
MMLMKVEAVCLWWRRGLRHHGQGSRKEVGGRTGSRQGISVALGSGVFPRRCRQKLAESPEQEFPAA